MVVFPFLILRNQISIKSKFTFNVLQILIEAASQKTGLTEDGVVIMKAFRIILIKINLNI